MKEWWKIASMIGLITGCTVDADPAPASDDSHYWCRLQEDEWGQRVCVPDFNRAGSSAGGGSHSAGTAPVAVTGGTNAGGASHGAGTAPVAVTGGTSAGGTTWEASGGATEVGGWTTAAGGVIVGGTGPYDPGGGTSIAGTAAGGGVPGVGLNLCSDFLVPYDPSLTLEQHSELEASICSSFGAIVALVVSTPNGDVLTCCSDAEDPAGGGGLSGGGGAPAAGTTGVPVTGGVAPR